MVRVLRQAEEMEKTATEVCKEHGVSQQTLYRWKRQFGPRDVPDTCDYKPIEKDDSKIIGLLEVLKSLP